MPRYRYAIVDAASDLSDPARVLVGNAVRAASSPARLARYCRRHHRGGGRRPVLLFVEVDRHGRHLTVYGRRPLRPLTYAPSKLVVRRK